MVSSKNRACESGPRPKLKHRTRAQAQAHLERERTRSGIDPASWDIYQCRHCGFLHVGHAGNRDNPRTRRGKR